jgi:HPt (histidine-containing phosphotransfer) domain-containing protein
VLDSTLQRGAYFRHFFFDRAILLRSECNKQSIACKKREKTEINISKDIEDIQLYNEARVNEKNKVKKIDNIIEELDLDVDTAQMLLDDFMDQWSGFKIKINEALINLNHEEIRSIAHSIKGAAGSLQLNEIYLICKDLEQIAKEQNDKNIIETYKIYIEKLILEIENN